MFHVHVKWSNGPDLIHESSGIHESRYLNVPSNGSSDIASYLWASDICSQVANDFIVNIYIYCFYKLKTKNAESYMLLSSEALA